LLGLIGLQSKIDSIDLAFIFWTPNKQTMNFQSVENKWKVRMPIVECEPFGQCTCTNILDSQSFLIKIKNLNQRIFHTYLGQFIFANKKDKL